jgi:hypothetical protein
VTRFRVNEPDVVFEEFDEEIVLVNLDTGNYYSLSGTAPSIWIDLADGFSLDEVTNRIQFRHSGEPKVIGAAVAVFVDRLVSEQMLVEDADRQARPRAVSVEAPGNRTPFQVPVIESYADMQDLLMLDPIHDVDTAGWPVARPKT